MSKVVTMEGKDHQAEQDALASDMYLELLHHMTSCEDQGVTAYADIALQPDGSFPFPTNHSGNILELLGALEIMKAGLLQESVDYIHPEETT